MKYVYKKILSYHLFYYYIIMNKLAWTIIYEGNLNLDNFDLQYVINHIKENIYIIFLFWETNMQTSKEVIEYVRWKINWSILNYDISISTEDKLKLYSFKKWNYVLKTISWKNIDFDKVTSSINNAGNIVSIREAEENKIYWNRIIKIDYLM